MEADLDLVSISSCLNVFGFVCLFVLYLQDFELRNRQAILELDRTLNIIYYNAPVFEVKEMALTKCLRLWRTRDVSETPGQESECWINVWVFIGLL